MQSDSLTTSNRQTSGDSKPLSSLMGRHRKLVFFLKEKKRKKKRTQKKPSKYRAEQFTGLVIV